MYIDFRRVLTHLSDWWMHDVALVAVGSMETVLKEYVVSPRSLAIAA
jgi:hypothetical protein